MITRVSILLAVSSLILYSPRSTAGEGRPHLFVLAGEAGMEKLDEAKLFTPTVQSALGKDKVVVVKNAKADQPIYLKHGTNTLAVYANTVAEKTSQKEALSLTWT